MATAPSSGAIAIPILVEGTSSFPSILSGWAIAERISRARRSIASRQATCAASLDCPKQLRIWSQLSKLTRVPSTNSSTFTQRKISQAWLPLICSSHSPVFCGTSYSAMK